MQETGKDCIFGHVVSAFVALSRTASAVRNLRAVLLFADDGAAARRSAVSAQGSGPRQRRQRRALQGQGARRRPGNDDLLRRVRRAVYPVLARIHVLRAASSGGDVQRLPRRRIQAPVVGLQEGPDRLCDFRARRRRLCAERFNDDLFRHVCAHAASRAVRRACNGAGLGQHQRRQLHRRRGRALDLGRARLPAQLSCDLSERADDGVPRLHPAVRRGHRVVPAVQRRSEQGADGRCRFAAARRAARAARDENASSVLLAAARVRILSRRRDRAYQSLSAAVFHSPRTILPSSASRSCS